jgi:hypothetical protein
MSVMETVAAIRARVRMVWSVTPDGVKAALRTGWQNVTAAAILAVLAVMSAIVASASGADVDVLNVVVTGWTAVLAAVGTVVSSVRAYYMNRGDGNGARYN